jgi:hypothetical protein
MYDDELAEKDFTTAELRRICFSCPIFRECNAYGWQYERHGMFGGITGEERDAIRRDKWDNPKVKKLQKDLEELGVPLKVVILYKTDGRDLLF